MVPTMDLGDLVDPVELELEVQTLLVPLMPHGQELEPLFVVCNRALYILHKPISPFRAMDFLFQSRNKASPAFCCC